MPLTDIEVEELKQARASLYGKRIAANYTLQCATDNRATLQQTQAALLECKQSAADAKALLEQKRAHLLDEVSLRNDACIQAEKQREKAQKKLSALMQDMAFQQLLAEEKRLGEKFASANQERLGCEAEAFKTKKARDKADAEKTAVCSEVAAAQTGLGAARTAVERAIAEAKEACEEIQKDAKDKDGQILAVQGELSALRKEIGALDTALVQTEKEQVHLLERQPIDDMQRDNAEAWFKQTRAALERHQKQLNDDLRAAALSRAPMDAETARNPSAKESEVLPSEIAAIEARRVYDGAGAAFEEARQKAQNTRDRIVAIPAEIVAMKARRGTIEKEMSEQDSALEKLNKEHQSLHSAWEAQKREIQKGETALQSRARATMAAGSKPTPKQNAQNVVNTVKTAGFASEPVHTTSRPCATRPQSPIDKALEKMREAQDEHAAATKACENATGDFNKAERLFGIAKHSADEWKQLALAIDTELRAISAQACFSHLAKLQNELEGATKAEAGRQERLNDIAGLEKEISDLIANATVLSQRPVIQPADQARYDLKPVGFASGHVIGGSYKIVNNKLEVTGGHHKNTNSGLIFRERQDLPRKSIGGYRFYTCDVSVRTSGGAVVNKEHPSSMWPDNWLMEDIERAALVALQKQPPHRGNVVTGECKVNGDTLKVFAQCSDTPDFYNSVYPDLT